MKALILALALVINGIDGFSQHLEKRYVDFLSNNFKYNDIYVVIPVIEGISQSKIVITNRSLHNYYLTENFDQAKMNYDLFLFQLFNQNLKINKAALSPKSFEYIDPKLEIFKQYKRHGIKYIINKYLIATDGKFKQKSLSNSTLNGLIQIMFDNSYIAQFSDYEGYFYFINKFNR